MSPSAMIQDNFAERLRFWRMSQNLTQADAATRLDIDRAYLSQIERGRAPGNALRTRFLLLERAAPIKTSPNVGSAYNLRNLPVLSWAQAGQRPTTAKFPPIGTRWCRATCPTSGPLACGCAVIRWSPVFPTATSPSCCRVSRRPTATSSWPTEGGGRAL